jgi:hypothetical protein
MESLRRFRLAHRKAAARLISANPHSPTMFTDQRAAFDSHSGIKALPAVALEAIQHLDPNSPNFGQFRWMAGFDGLGNAPIGG